MNVLRSDHRMHRTHLLRTALSMHRRHFVFHLHVGRAATDGFHLEGLLRTGAGLMKGRRSSDERSARARRVCRS